MQEHKKHAKACTCPHCRFTRLCLELNAKPPGEAKSWEALAMETPHSLWILSSIRPGVGRRILWSRNL